jgi:arsenate reductase
MLKFYAYTGCSTCRKARKWLESQGVAFEEVAIREQPPSKKELKAVLASLDGELKRLFNTSGQDYRALGMKDRLPSMTTEEAMDLLAGRGNLIKRPLVVDSESGKGVTGFKESEWLSLFAK